MKKSILYLFAAMFSACVITSCGDDDPVPNPTPTPDPGPGIDTTWTEDNWEAEYKNDKLTLTLGETALPLDNKSVVVNATETETERTAVVTLNNVLPEDPALEIDVELQLVDSENFNYAFTGQAEAGTSTVEINGTIEGDALSLVINRTLSGALVGNWDLARTALGLPDVYVEIKTGVELVDNLISTAVGPVIGQKLAEKVEAIHVNLPESGIFNVSWRKTGATEDEGIPAAIASMFAIPYTFDDNTFTVAIDKSYVTLLTGMVGDKLTELGLSTEELLALLTDMGGYYGVTLNTTTEGDKVTFYADKKIAQPLLNILLPMITEGSVSEEIQGVIETLIPLLPAAETVNVGLAFQKAE